MVAAFSLFEYSERCSDVSLCVGVSSQIRYVDILILSLYNGSNIVHNGQRMLCNNMILWKTNYWKK